MADIVSAVILAGGLGERTGKGTPKQLLEIGGEPIIVRCIRKFEIHPSISNIIIVSHQDYMDKITGLIADLNMTKVKGVVQGGRTRQESAFAGLKSCSRDTKWVLLHDAARPFVRGEVISRTLEAAKSYGAAAPVIETRDTIVEENDGMLMNIPDRTILKRIQTPQAFAYKTIFSAHKNAFSEGINDYTDDCGLVLSSGNSVKLVQGDSLNIKITTNMDLELAEKYLSYEGTDGS